MRNTLAVLLSVFTIGYFVPTTVAIIRKRTNTTAIFLLNFFLGLTVIGWIVALIWATTEDNKQKVLETKA
jgi:hypothetical protein